MAKKLKKRAPSTAKRRNIKITKSNVFEHVSLKLLRLLGVNARLEIIDGKTPQQAQLQTSFSVAPSQDNTIHVDGRLSLVGRAEGADSDGAPPLTMDIDYQCVYSVDVAVEEVEKHGDKLALSGLVAMWPHFRELVQSITGRMGIPTFTLPMLAPGVEGGLAAQRITFKESPTKKKVKKVKKTKAAKKKK